MDVGTPTVSKRNKKAVYLDKKTTTMVKGLYPDYNKIEEQTIIKGRHLNDVDIKENRKVCILGDRIYENLFDKEEDPIGKYVKVVGIYYPVIGVAK